MKLRWWKYFPLLAGIMLFIACNSHNHTTAPADTDPVLNTDPNLKKLTEKIHNSPNDAVLYYNRGNMLQRMQMDSLAFKDFRTAASLDTNNAEYLSAIGNLLFEDRDLTGSIVWLQKAIDKNPTDQKAHLKIAKLFLYIKDYPKSFAEINIVLRKNVFSPEAYFLKGMLYKDMKDTAKAISNFLTARQYAPDYHDALIQLGVLYIAKKDPIALEYLNDAFIADSSDVFPIYARGMYYQQTKDYEKAKEEYKKCIILNNHYVDAYFNMGFVYMQQDSVKKAYHQYDIVTKIDPRNPTGYYNRGYCSEAMDSLRNAVADYRMAASMDTAYKSPKLALQRLGVK